MGVAGNHRRSLALATVPRVRSLRAGLGADVVDAHGAGRGVAAVRGLVAVIAVLRAGAGALADETAVGPVAVAEAAAAPGARRTTCPPPAGVRLTQKDARSGNTATRPSLMSHTLATRRGSTRRRTRQGAEVTGAPEGFASPSSCVTLEASRATLTHDGLPIDDFVETNVRGRPSRLRTLRRLTVRATVADPASVAKMLAALRRPRAPPAAARSPPQAARPVAPWPTCVSRLRLVGRSPTISPRRRS